MLSMVSEYADYDERWMGWVNPSDAWGHSFDFLFVDELGQVELADCWTIQVLGMGPFKGVERWELQPQHLIFDGNGKVWQNVSEVVTYVPMLRHWMRDGEDLIGWNFGDGKDWLKINLKEPKSIPLHGGLNHQIVIQAHARPLGMNKGIEAFTDARIITRLEDPAERDVAFQEHSAILDFLSIIYGEPVGFSERIICSSSNPTLDASHHPIAPDVWEECRLETLSNGNALLDLEKDHNPEPLIRYSAENPEILSCWLEFWVNNKPGIDALKRAISEKSSRENQLFNVAVAIEEFGHKIPGRRELGTVDNCFPVYLKRICLSMPRIAMMRPELWANRFNNAFKGIKHADNEYPELAEIVLTAAQGIDWLRAWCCFQVDPDNPIKDDTWMRINNTQEFYPKTENEFDNCNWLTLFTDEEWAQEIDRLAKAATNFHRSHADAFDPSDQNNVADDRPGD